MECMKFISKNITCIKKKFSEIKCFVKKTFFFYLFATETLESASTMRVFKNYKNN